MKKAVTLVALLLFVAASSAANATAKKKETVGSGQPRAAACLQTCRQTYRAVPGFRQNPANKWFCWNKCGMS